MRQRPHFLLLLFVTALFIFQSGCTNCAIKPIYEFAWPFFDGLAKVKVDGKWGFIDKSGEFVIEPTLEKAGWFSQGLAQIVIDNKFGFIDKAGKVIIEPRFD